MISKKEFIEIINKLKEVDAFVEQTNNNAKKLHDAIVSDFFNASSLMISHENIVVKLLENMFDDRDSMISWWLYENDYGRKFKMGSFSVNDVDIDLTTPEKLYDYLVEVWKNEQI